MHILLVSPDEKKSQEYLDNLIKENKVNKNNIFEIRPLKEEIVISQIKDLKKELLTQVKDGRWIVFFQFETANLESQNALLKTIEETTRDSFILVTNNEYKTVSTLRSRLKIIRLKSDQAVRLSKAEYDQYLSLDQQPLQQFNLVSKLDWQASLDFLDRLLIYYRSTLLQSKKAVRVIKKILYLRKLIQDNNLNCQLALDNLLIFISKASMM